MKIQVGFKCPDAVSIALDDIVNKDKREEAREIIGEFVEYGEYITVEFDTVKKTATVIKK